MTKTMRFRSKAKPINQTNANSSLYNSLMAITYGSVKENNTDGTCNILLVNGFLSSNVRIPSTVFASKDPLTGGITYPTIGSEVIILHPVDDINSGFILPAGLDFRDDDVKSELLDQGDKTIFPGEWILEYDPSNGLLTITNGDTFELIVDPENESVSYTDFKGNTIKSNDDTLEINGTIEVARKDDEIKSTAVEDSTYWPWLQGFVGIFTAWVPVPNDGGLVLKTALSTFLLTNPVPKELVGKITEGSEKVKVG